jgi:hypothetical protein
MSLAETAQPQIVPPLQPGDRLTADEFERSYGTKH